MFGIVTHSDLQVKNKRVMPLVLIFLLTMVSAISPTRTYGQDVADSVRTQSLIEPLDISGLPEFSDVSRSLIKQVKSLPEKHSQVEKIISDLEISLKDVAEKLKLYNDTNSTILLDRLDKEIRELKIKGDRLEVWSTKIDQWNNEVVLVKVQLDSLLTIGKISIDSIHKKEEVSPFEVEDTLVAQNSDEKAIKTRFQKELESQLSDLSTARDTVLKWSRKLQLLQNNLSIAEEDLNDAMAALKEKKEVMSSQIWVPEYPPIWKITITIPEGSFKSEIKSIYSNSLKISQGFFTNNLYLPYFIVFTFILFLGLTLYLRKNAGVLYDAFKEKLESSRAILDRPILSSLILTWFTLSIFSDLPIEVTRLIAILMIIPTTYMFRVLDKKNDFKRIIIFMGLYLTFLIMPTLNFFPVIQRFTLLAFDVLAFLVLLWLKRNKNEVDDIEDLWFGKLPFIMSLFMLLSLIGIVTNVIGSVQLAQLLTSAILGTFVFFIILAEAIHLFRSILFLSLFGPLFKQSYILKEDGETVFKMLYKVLRVVGFYFWIYFTLNLLTVWDVFYVALTTFINAAVKVGGVSISLGSVLAFFIVIQVSIWIANFISYFIDKEVIPRKKKNAGVLSSMSLLVRYFLITIGFLFALASAGIPLGKLAIALGALGVGIGFGLKNIVNNIFSGIILAIERPIHIGDTVGVGTVEGKVVKIGFRSCQIRNWDGADVVIPNGKMLSEDLTNWTLTDRIRRITVPVRVPFDSDIPAVSQLMIDAVKDHPGVRKAPSPYTNFKGIGDSAMQINFYYWIDDVNDIVTLGTIVRAIVYEALIDAGYETPVPKQNVRMISEDAK